LTNCPPLIIFITTEEKVSKQFSKEIGNGKEENDL
jgi:hypothetical protein